MQSPSAKTQSFEDYLPNFQISDEDPWPVNQATSKGIGKVDGVGQMIIVDWAKDRLRPGSKCISRSIKFVGLKLRGPLWPEGGQQKDPPISPQRPIVLPVNGGFTTLGEVFALWLVWRLFRTVGRQELNKVAQRVGVKLNWSQLKKGLA